MFYLPKNWTAARRQEHEYSSSGTLDARPPAPTAEGGVYELRWGAQQIFGNVGMLDLMKSNQVRS